MQRNPNLIIVSNRLPIQVAERGGKLSVRESDGGLARGLKGYFDREGTSARFQERIWIGAADFPESRWTRYRDSQVTAASFSVEPIFVNKKAYSNYYNGFCNATLWPLFHYFPSFAEFSNKTFESYEKVNGEFCEKVLSVAKDGDTVWIHDYQLLLLPELLRKKRPDLSIGFFLHIPFPSFELFRLLHKAWKVKLITGLLGADLIGFHTHDYMHHFLDSVQKIMGITGAAHFINWDNRKLKVGVFPLGIDYKKFHAVSDSRLVRREKADIRLKLEPYKIIFSVDRLDYTKGITHRLAGFEEFLEKFTEWRGNVIFILVVLPSRQIISKYNERKIMIEERVSRINGKYSTLNWQPILYRYNTLSFTELSALYQTAHVALITPLRDGMNLVAKEYVASRVDKSGVLILSELAGAAHEMSEALLVNPTDKTEVADAIAIGLNMTPGEQERRITILQEKLKQNEVFGWMSSFIDELAGIVSVRQARMPRSITPGIALNLKKKVGEAHRRLILFDYDGTLAPFNDYPEQATPSREVIESIREIATGKENDVAIISGRKLETLERWFGELPIHLIGEHGAKLKLLDQEAVTQIQHPPLFSEAIRSTLEMFTIRCQGSHVEEKEFSLAWHYRKVNTDEGFKQSRELIDCLNHLVIGSSLAVIDGNKVIEVRSVLASKGVAAQWVSGLLSPDLVIAFGDDITDEDMFEQLDYGAITIKIGNGVTNATYSLAQQENVLPFIRTLFLSHEQESV